MNPSKTAMVCPLRAKANHISPIKRQYPRPIRDFDAHAYQHLPARWTNPVGFVLTDAARKVDGLTRQEVRIDLSFSGSGVEERPTNIGEQRVNLTNDSNIAEAYNAGVGQCERGGEQVVGYYRRLRLNFHTWPKEDSERTHCGAHNSERLI